LVVAADLAGGELMEDEATGLVEGLGGDYFAAQIAEVFEPVAGVEWELSVDLLAKALSEGGRGSGGGDRDLEIAAADDGGEVEVAEGRVVDRVAEDVVGCGLLEDGVIYGGEVGCGYYEEVAFDIAGSEGAKVEGDFSGGGEVVDFGAGIGSDDGDFALGGEDGFDF
jgi:hypothetical protein